MNLITLTNARADQGLLTVTGKCEDSPEFLRYINSACQRLLKRGDWCNSLFIYEGCVRDDCIVWPRQVGKVRAIKFCNGSIPIEDRWGSFMPFTPGSWRYSFNGGTLLWDSDFRIEQRNLSPIQRQIPCAAVNWYVRLYIERQADIGKTVTIYGVDTHGQIIRTTKANGDYTEGVTLVATNPYASTPFPVRSVTRVSLDPPFIGNSRLFAYDADNNQLHNMAFYEPGETEPGYVYSRLIRNCCGSSIGSCSGVRTIKALAKISSDPMKLGTDLLPIQDLEAVKLAVQSIRKEEEGDVVTSRERLDAAVRELNRSERDWIPDYQIPVQIYPWGSARLEYQRIGLIN